MKKAVFFCSAVADIKAQYNEAARRIVRAVCAKGYSIMSGGTTKGTMKVISDEAAACGAVVEGVLPRFMAGLEHPALTNVFWSDTMSQRKEGMREGTCLAIALPGGIGTLDELSETFCLVKMGIYRGRVIVYNPDGFYDSYKAQLERCVAENMMPAGAMDSISFPETVEELVALL